MNSFKKSLQPAGIIAAVSVLMLIGAIYLITQGSMIPGSLIAVAALVNAVLLIAKNLLRSQPQPSEVRPHEVRPHEVRPSEKEVSIAWYMLFPAVWIALAVGFHATKDDLFTYLLLMYAVAFTAAIVLAIARGESLNPKQVLDKML